MTYAARYILFVLLFLSSSLGSYASAGEPGKVNLIAPWKAYYLSKHSGSGKTHTVIIDVRGQEAYAQRHIEGALNIPGFILPTKSFPQDWHLVLSCSSLGMKDSIDTAAKLAEKGVRNLQVLDGGIEAWEGSGLPIVGHRKNEVRAIMSKNLVWALAYGARVTIVDIRSRNEFEERHVPGAKNIPLEAAQGIPLSLQDFLGAIQRQDRNEFEKELLTLSADEQAAARPYARTEVVVIGRPGPEAENLTRQLRVKGYSNVRFLYGGFAAIRGLIEKKGPKPEANKA